MGAKFQILNMKNKNSYRILSPFSLLFVLLLLLSSCKVTKHLFRRHTAAKTANLENFFLTAYSTQMPFRTLKIRFSGKIKTTNNSLNTSGQIRILKDSLIWANATALFGIEVGRVLLTKDSAFLQNNIKHTIDIWPIQKFLISFGIQVDISALQSLLLGQFVRLKADSFHIIENVQKDSASYLYQARYLSISSKKAFDYTSVLSLQNMLVDSLNVLQMPQQNKLTVNYKNYLQVRQYIVPASFSVRLEKQNSTDKFAINYKKIYLNKLFSIPALSLDEYKIIKH